MNMFARPNGTTVRRNEHPHGEVTSQSIQFERVSKRFPHNGDYIDVLKDVSFGVKEGEFVVILGPSGCGKTTLLKIIAGIVEPTMGYLTVGNRTVSGPSSNIAMVFQEFVLLPWKTVLENVELGLKIQGIEDRSRRLGAAKGWIDDVGLEGFGDAYPHELSGGMKQRVGLARALAVNPTVLLMDEPFGSLDAQTRDRLQTDLIRLWQEERQTVVFVTHDIDEAIYLGDRVLVLSDKPSTISANVDVDIERPRWQRRVEVEQSDEFGRIKRRLRSELCLHPG